MTDADKLLKCQQQLCEAHELIIRRARELAEARAALNDFAWLVDAIYDFDSLALVVPGFNKWHERYAAALKAAREQS